MSTNDKEPKRCSDIARLRPDFAARLQALLAGVNLELGHRAHCPGHFIVVETYRSKARQLWLYRHGRTPQRVPTHHLEGTAADVLLLSNQGTAVWSNASGAYTRLYESAKNQGLVTGMVWRSRDLGHVELGPQ